MGLPFLEILNHSPTMYSTKINAPGHDDDIIFGQSFLYYGMTRIQLLVNSHLVYYINVEKYKVKSRDDILDILKQPIDVFASIDHDIDITSRDTCHVCDLPINTNQYIIHLMQQHSNFTKSANKT